MKNRKSFVLAHLLATSLLITTIPSASWAASYTWDPSNTPATPAGGTGTWDLSSSFWSNGTTDQAWTDTTGTADTATFGGTAGTVTLGASLGAQGLIFTKTGYTIALGANTLSLGSAGIDASALASGTTTISGSGSLALVAAQTWNVGTGATLSVSSVISGSGSLNKSGTGTLSLSAANTFAGGSTITNGILILNGTTGSMGTGTLTLAGGNLVKAGSANQALATANAINVTGTTVLSSRNTGDWTFSSAVTGTGTISVTNTAVNGTGPVSNSIVFNGDLSGFTGTFSQNTLTGSTAGNRLRFGSSAASGTSTTINLSNGKLVMSGATSVSGTPTVVDLGDNLYGTFKIGELSGTGGVMRGGWSTAGNTTFEIGALNTNASFAGSLQDNPRGSTGLSLLNKVGTGTLTLAGPNTYTGTTTVTSGTLQLGNGTAGTLSTTTAVSVASGATLAFDQATGATFSNAIADTGTVQGVQGSGITNTLSGVISGTGGVTQNGSGTMNLSGADTYTGATTVTSGTLALTGSGSIASTSGITVNGNSAIFTSSSSTAVAPAVALTLGSAGVSGGGTLSSVSVVDSLSNTILTGAGGGTITGLTMNGAGTFQWSNGSTLNVNNLTLNGSAGSLLIKGVAASWTNGVYTLLSALNLLGSDPSLSAFAVGNVTGNFTGLTSRQSAVTSISGNTIVLTISGDSPKWTGATSSAWDTATANWKLITGGTTTTFLASDAVLFDDTATSSAVAINSGNVSPSSVTFNNSTLNYTLTGSNGIAGTGTLVKNGTASVTISNTNTYSGGTTINAGTLSTNASGALGAGGW
ncbi:MAG: autotransporter-associated beta strand repeat-containing protein [Chthoniobacteraceae bacterium]